MRAVQGWWDLVSGKFFQKSTIRCPKRSSGHVSWCSFNCWRSLCIHVTLVALTFFCKWRQYSSFASEDNQTSKACQWEGGCYKPALCTCDSENTSQGIKTKRCLIFLTLFKLLASATKIARKSNFSTIVFRFFDSRTHINYIENFMVFSTLTASSHDRLRTRPRTFLRLRTWRVSQLN